MRHFFKQFTKDFLISIRDLAPLVLVISFFQFVIVQKSIDNLSETLFGIFFVLIGLTLFIRGLELALFPLGENLAHAFAHKKNILLLLFFAFFLGFGTTLAEPALMAIAKKAALEAANSYVIENNTYSIEKYALYFRLVVAFAVGFSLIVGIFRIFKNIPIAKLLSIGYLIAIALSFIAPTKIIAIAYDSGGVTTSTVTVPLVTALGIGLSTSLKGRNPLLDGFGLIAFASLFPIIFVMLFGILKW